MSEDGKEKGAKETQSGEKKKSSRGQHPENLIPLTKRSPEEAAEIRRMGAEASNKVQREKKLLSQMIEKWIDKDHEIKGKDGSTRSMTTDEMVETTLNRGLLTGGNVSIATLKFIHEATEGKKVNLTGAEGEALDLVINIIPVKPAATEI